MHAAENAGENHCIVLLPPYSAWTFPARDSVVAWGPRDSQLCKDLSIGVRDQEEPEGEVEVEPEDEVLLDDRARSPALSRLAVRRIQGLRRRNANWSPAGSGRASHGGPVLKFAPVSTTSDRHDHSVPSLYSVWSTLLKILAATLLCAALASGVVSPGTLLGPVGSCVHASLSARLDRLGPRARQRGRGRRFARRAATALVYRHLARVVSAWLIVAGVWAAS